MTFLSPTPFLQVVGRSVGQVGVSRIVLPFTSLYNFLSAPFCLVEPQNSTKYSCSTALWSGCVGAWAKVQHRGVAASTTQHTPKPNDEPTERLKKLSRCAVPAAAVHRTPESAPRFDGLSRSRVAPGFGFVILCQRSLVPRRKRAREKPEGACLALNRLLPRVG